MSKTIIYLQKIVYTFVYKPKCVRNPATCSNAVDTCDACFSALWFSVTYVRQQKTINKIKRNIQKLVIHQTVSFSLILRVSNCWVSISSCAGMHEMSMACENMLHLGRWLFIHLLRNLIFISIHEHNSNNVRLFCAIPSVFTVNLKLQMSSLTILHFEVFFSGLNFILLFFRNF